MPENQKRKRGRPRKHDPPVQEPENLPRRRGRPRKHPLPDLSAPKRPPGRPKKKSPRLKRALPTPPLEHRREEWKPYPFKGGAKTKARKVEVLAHLEELFTDTEACRAAGVLRYQYELWYEDDEHFRAAVEKAIDVCVRRVEAVMWRAATTLDEKGKVQTTAAFGILNTKTADWGLLKSQLYARLNRVLIHEISKLLLAKTSAEVTNEIRAGLDEILHRALRLPPGTSLR